MAEGLPGWMRRRLDEALARVNAEFAASYPDLAAQGFCIDYADVPLLDGPAPSEPEPGSGS